MKRQVIVFRVLSERGKDTPLCGSFVEPCQTLPQALLMVRDGEKICLDGRNSESHPYTCLPMNSSDKGKIKATHKSMTTQSWFSKAFISCKLHGLTFQHARNRTLNLILSHLVFHSNGVIRSNVTCFNVFVKNCRFVNCRNALVVEQAESKVCKTSSLVITDTEFLYNRISVHAYVFNNLLIAKIVRGIFQGNVRRFKVTSNNRNITGAVYIKSQTRAHIVGFITDSIYRELANDFNGLCAVI